MSHIHSVVPITAPGQALAQGKATESGADRAPQSSQSAAVQASSVFSSLPSHIHSPAISGTRSQNKTPKAPREPRPLGSPLTSTLVLSSAASGGGTSCGRKYPGRCKLHCHSQERSIFICDRYRLCCMKNPIEGITASPVHRAKHPCRKTTESQNVEQQMASTPQPLSSPSIPSTVISS